MRVKIECGSGAPADGDEFESVGGSPLSSTELNSGRHLLVLATAVE